MELEAKSKDGAAAVRKHAVLSPSAAKRWGLCHASPLISKGIRSESSEAAKLGSLAHRMAELMLREAFSGFLGAAPVPDEAELKQLDDLPDDFKRYADKYVSRIKSRFVGDPHEKTLFVAVEQRLPVSWLTGEADAFGTADFIAVTENKISGMATLYVVDFKTGQTYVNVQGNEQLFIYAASALRILPELDPFLPEIQRVCVAIVQPSVMDQPQFISGPAKPFRDGSHEVLLVQNAAKRCLDLYNGAAEIEDSDWPTRVKPEQLAQFCKYCPGQYRCPFMAKRISQALSIESAPAAAQEDGTAPVAEPRVIPMPDTPEEISKAYAFVPLVEQWCEAVRKEVYERLSREESVPGWKLVAGRAGVRRWADEGAAAKELRGSLKKSEAFEEKLISPTKAEKLHKDGRISDLRWKRLQPLIVRPEPKPTIVPDTDARPAIGESIVEEFQVLDNADS